ncbi:uncharacterized protein LOC107853357 [Capsicum annuum]|uniref:uncharacterized protein LOC107853357 n=1 Tax=Capsicum annuum TaxID=4072 RepID=UPI0007BED2E9|nr:uncharacterized protein LOC107853357 [Capsicum annuum]
MAPQKEISYNLPAFPSHFPPYLDKYDVETCRTLMKREFRKIVAARMRSNKSVRLNAVPQVAIKRVAGGEFGPCNGQTCIGIDYVLMETQFSPVLGKVTQAIGSIIQGKALSNHGQLRAPLPSEIDLSSLRSGAPECTNTDKVRPKAKVS